MPPILKNTKMQRVRSKHLIVKTGVRALTYCRKTAKKCLDILLRKYPTSETFLIQSNPFELLIAVILSAQCTDAQVNRVTPKLFARYPTPRDLAQAKQEQVEKLIYSCGFYRNKTKAIIQCSKNLVDKFGGIVPQTLEALITLRGVGRKTASVVLYQAFGFPAIAVDTHVARVSTRLGWAHQPDPIMVERELMRLIPKNRWGLINNLLIRLGRETCKARKPLCHSCPLNRNCPTGRPAVKLQRPKSLHHTLKPNVILSTVII